MSRTVCIIDSGLFTDFATTLAKTFDKVYLYVPCESNPSSNQMMIGQGLEGIEKVDSFWPLIDTVDLWIFLDVYYGPLQEYLVSIGCRVWGSRMGEELELFRDDAKTHFKEIGINVGPYEIVDGISNLREYLKKHENVFVKVSRSRGDFETFHSKSYDLIEPFLDALEHKLGAKKDLMRFIVEDAIDDAIELGYDGYCIDGKYPSKVMAGIEIKDTAYVGIIKPYKKMPVSMIDINTRLSDTFKGYKYRNFWSSEFRIDRSGKAWMIDPCCRAGSPPSQLQQLMYTNLAEIIWEGSEGKCIDPVARDKWGALVLIHSDWVLQNWQTIRFPETLRDNVRLHFPVVVDNKYYMAPQKDQIVGAVVGHGETMEDAIAQAKEVASHVEGYGLDIPISALDDAQSEIDKLSDFGVLL